MTLYFIVFSILMIASKHYLSDKQTNIIFVVLSMLSSAALFIDLSAGIEILRVEKYIKAIVISFIIIRAIYYLTILIEQSNTNLPIWKYEGILIALTLVNIPELHYFVAVIIAFYIGFKVEDKSIKISKLLIYTVLVYGVGMSKAKLFGIDISIIPMIFFAYEFVTKSSESLGVYLTWCLLLFYLKIESITSTTFIVISIFLLIIEFKNILVSKHKGILNNMIKKNRWLDRVVTRIMVAQEGNLNYKIQKQTIYQADHTIRIKSIELRHISDKYISYLAVLVLILISMVNGGAW